MSAISFSQKLGMTITCHAWNKDRSKLAFSPNNHEVHIWAKKGNTFVPEVVLAEHDKTVTGIDWAPNSNRILTCAQDRNAYVWTLTDGKWKPMLVLLRITRAATHCKWSPLENKFAVASGAKVIAVCFFDEEGNWWVSKHIRKHKSTVTSVAWHPNNLTLLTGSTDFRTRIVSAAIKQAGDKKAGLGPFADKPFGEVLYEFPASGGWVHSVAWSPSGNRLAFTSHDSSVTFAQITGPDQAPTAQTVRTNHLPYRSGVFLCEDSFVAAGYDCNPTHYACANGTWGAPRPLDTASAAKTGASSAMNKFKSADSKGSTDIETKLTTKHQNAITTVLAHNGKDFSSGSIDGMLVVWSGAALKV